MGFPEHGNKPSNSAPFPPKRKAVNFLISRVTITFLRRSPLHGLRRLLLFPEMDSPALCILNFISSSGSTVTLERVIF
jgi:hypothetical protein